MDLDDLNKEMSALQNDFQHYKLDNSSQTNNQKQFQKQFPNQNEVNFQPVKNNIDTTQIKRPSKSGDHRNDINEKMNMINSTYFTPELVNQNSPDVINRLNQSNQASRNNNSNYVNTMKSSPTRQTESESYDNNNTFASYYNNNFDTLQSNNKINNKSQTHYSTIDMLTSSYDNFYENHTQNQDQNQNTHDNGISMLNVRNIFPINNNTENDIPNKVNNTGYHRIEEKKSDYRQNMNNKIDGMIFDNPNALPINPILQHSKNNMNKDTRMVIQDSNKDYYRQSANDRISQYSPLSRASNIPIHMANMSVNDFYSTMYNDNSGVNNSGINKSLINEEHNKIKSKEMLNNRINSYAPLAKTVQYQTNQTTPSKMTQPQPPHKIQQPQQWNPTDVNGKLKNVVYNQLPIISNTERV